MQIPAALLTIFNLSRTNKMQLIDKITNLTTIIITLCKIHKHANEQVNAKVSSKKYLQKYLEDTILYLLNAFKKYFAQQ